MDETGFTPCICHTGVMWDTQEIDADGHCPEWRYNQDGGVEFEEPLTAADHMPYYPDI